VPGPSASVSEFNACGGTDTIPAIADLELHRELDERLSNDHVKFREDDGTCA
jgi:hypothetical protein